MGAAAAIGAAAVGTIGSGLIQANAAGDASKKQQQAIQQAEGFLNSLWGQAQGFQIPFLNAGTAAANTLTNLTGTGPGGNPQTSWLTRPFAPTMDQLSQTPGYQFALTQGLQATQNSNAAKGLGISGEALAGAGKYAEGLASTTYQNQFENDLRSRQTAFNMLSGIMNTGATAGANLGQQATATGGALAGQAVNMGNAQAAGIMGQGNAFAGIVSGLTNAFSNTTMAGLMNPQLGAQIPWLGSSYASGMPNYNMNFGTPNLTWNPNNAIGTDSLNFGTRNPFNSNY